MAEKEINKRVDIVLKAIDIQKSLVVELKKIDRDDITSYEGGIKKTSMSEQRFKELNSLNEKIAGFNTAFETALKNNDPEHYKKLADKVAQLGAQYSKAPGTPKVKGESEE